jgi:hypothetical protein
MNNISVAEPQLMDTGTMFAETPICTSCLLPIVRVAVRPNRIEKVSRAWIHRHNRSIYCQGQGN